MQLDLSKLDLKVGSHPSRDDGVCLLEAVAWMAGEPHSDSPACTSPVIAAFGRRINDSLPDDLRQQLVPYIPRMIGTVASAKIEARRIYMLADWSARVVVPYAMEIIGAHCWAEELRALPEIVDPESAGEAESWLRFAQATAAAADAAAYTAAADAAAYTAYTAAATATAAAAAAAYTAAAAAAAYTAAATAAAADDAYADDAYAYAAYKEAKARAWADLLPGALAVLDRMIALSDAS